MTNRENSKVRVGSLIFTIIFLGFILSMLVYGCVNSLRDNDYIEYKEKYDKYYEHQLNYLMNTPIEAGDKYNSDKLCKIITLSFTPTGNPFTSNGKVYYAQYTAIIYNNSDEDVLDVEAFFPYVSYLGVKGSRWVWCEKISANSYARVTISSSNHEDIELLGFAYVSTEDCTGQAICYKETGNDIQLSVEDAKKLIDEDVINNIVGGKVEPLSQAQLIELALPMLIVAGIFGIMIISVIIKSIIVIKKLRSGKYVVVNGRLLSIYDPEAINRVRNQADEAKLRQIAEEKGYSPKEYYQKLKELDQKPLPSDFDDGHPTNHNCGGFDIDPDDFKIDPNNY